MELPKGLALMNVKDLLTMIEVSPIHRPYEMLTKVVERTEQVS
jgi:hypothetical protein